jgi:hypothetical protein
MVVGALAESERPKFNSVLIRPDGLLPSAVAGFVGINGSTG